MSSHQQPQYPSLNQVSRRTAYAGRQSPVIAVGTLQPVCLGQTMLSALSQRLGAIGLISVTLTLRRGDDRLGDTICLDRITERGITIWRRDIIDVDTDKIIVNDLDVPRHLTSCGFGPSEHYGFEGMPIGMLNRLKAGQSAFVTADLTAMTDAHPRRKRNPMVSKIHLVQIISMIAAANRGR